MGGARHQPALRSESDGPLVPAPRGAPHAGVSRQAPARRPGRAVGLHPVAEERADLGSVVRAGTTRATGRTGRRLDASTESAWREISIRARHRYTDGARSFFRTGGAPPSRRSLERRSVARDHVSIESTAPLHRPLLREVIDVDQPETLRVPVLPLEV